MQEVPQHQKEHPPHHPGAALSGTDDNGRPYNRVVWRRVQCANCGQHRVEIEKHYDGDPL